MLDMGAYFARIGYEGTPRVDLATLQTLHLLHPAAIVFENLDPLLGRPVPLDIPALQAKLVASRRGGYCFEQNTLFKAVLEKLGFSVTPLAARVLWMAPAGAPPNPRAHMVLKIELEEGAYLADVGFGGLLASSPLRLVYGVEQETPTGILRLVERDVHVTLQARLASEWRDVYRFTLEPQFSIDIEMANWFTSTHPNSRFRNALMVQRLTPNGRVSLLNRRLARRFVDGRVEEGMLTDARELEETLGAEFGIEPPADLAPVFARLPAG
ncbi:MAG: arylamine N-acetyltransferase [Hyphomicrobiales bacterium]|nr:arylamine N-acetyltransferase [Hyphomicrobiales bacterium]